MASELPNQINIKRTEQYGAAMCYILTGRYQPQSPDQFGGFPLPCHDVVEKRNNCLGETWPPGKRCLKSACLNFAIKQVSISIFVFLFFAKIFFKEPPVNALLRLASTFLRFLSLDLLHHLLASSHLGICEPVKSKDLFCGLFVHLKHLQKVSSFKTCSKSIII